MRIRPVVPMTPMLRRKPSSDPAEPSRAASAAVELGPPRGALPVSRTAMALLLMPVIGSAVAYPFPVAISQAAVSLSGFSSSSARSARTSPKTGASSLSARTAPRSLSRARSARTASRSRSAAAASTSLASSGSLGQLGMDQGDGGDPQPQRGGQDADGQALRARHAAEPGRQGAQPARPRPRSRDPLRWSARAAARGRPDTRAPGPAAGREQRAVGERGRGVGTDASWIVTAMSTSSRAAAAAASRP